MGIWRLRRAPLAIFLAGCGGAAFTAEPSGDGVRGASSDASAPEAPFVGPVPTDPGDAGAPTVSGNDADAGAPSRDSGNVTGAVLEGATQVVAGDGHTCALLGTGRVVCWGANGHGQLGDGTFQSSARPVFVRDVTNADQISAGASHTCVRLQDGGAKCWGRGGDGQLGNGASQDSSTAVAVVDPRGTSPAANTVEVRAGELHTCARRRNSSIVCWGNNDVAQLGLAAPATSSKQVIVEGIDDAVQLAVGPSHVCVRHLVGTLTCWGENDRGQLGVAVDVTMSPPIALAPGAVVGGFTDVDDVVLGAGSSSCAHRRNGPVLCWGDNTGGQLGDAARTDPYDAAPRAIASAGVVDGVSIGSAHACGLTLRGGAKCWGTNLQGQLGDGSNRSARAPVDVVGLASSVKQLAAGFRHTCALRSDGTVVCWGDNSARALGDGTVDSRVAPVAVIAP